MSQELAFMLQKLSDEGRAVRSMVVTPLSDLPRSDVGLFGRTWSALSPARRRELVAELVEQAEKNIHLNFHAILRECLSDGDPGVRRMAVEGLWEDNRPTLVAPLVALLAGDPAPEVRAVAAQALGRFVLLGTLGDLSEDLAAGAERALRAAWSRPGESLEVRRRALESLAYSEGDDLAQLIERAYYDDDSLMRQSALYAMGRSAQLRWGSHVLSELSGSEAPMRFEAAQAAGELGLKAAVTPLIRLLDDPDSSVREAAALSLGQIGGARARRALEACTTCEDERLVEAAGDALAELSFNAEPLVPANAAVPGAGSRLRAAHEEGDGYPEDETDAFDPDEEDGDEPLPDDDPDPFAFDDDETDDWDDEDEEYAGDDDSDSADDDEDFD